MSAAGEEHDMPELVERVREVLNQDTDIAIPVAAMSELADMLRGTKEQTLIGVSKEIDRALAALTNGFPHLVSLRAGCELFRAHVSQYASCEGADVEGLKASLGDYRSMSVRTRSAIAQLGQEFIRDGTVLLTHGMSRVVTAIIKRAAQEGRRFRVIVTEGRPEGSGYQAAKALAEEPFPVPVTLTVDSGMGYAMEQATMVLVGAESVMESGGVVNKLGTYPLAMSARVMKRPFYVAAESYKFSRLFPLGQHDLPAKPDAALTPFGDHTLPESADTLTPAHDYTPAEHITLLFTDLGVLTPSAVSDELINLYYSNSGTVGRGRSL